MKDAAHGQHPSQDASTNENNKTAGKPKSDQGLLSIISILGGEKSHGLEL